MTYCVYELAQNVQIQDRLLYDLQSSIGDLDEKGHDWAQLYETFINDVPYLTAVVNESLRRYPPELRMERRVSAEGAKIRGVPMEKDVLIEVFRFLFSEFLNIYFFLNLFFL